MSVFTHPVWQRTMQGYEYIWQNQGKDKYILVVKVLVIWQSVIPQQLIFEESQLLFFCLGNIGI